MFSTIKLECISPRVNCSHRAIGKIFNLGSEKVFRERAWVAKITGLSDKYGLDREFVRAAKDYRRANSRGTRGVYASYMLEYGYIYEVSSPQSWSTTERYFLLAGPHGGERMSKSDVISWLKKSFSE
jgi:hypothetical protein